MAPGHKGLTFWLGREKFITRNRKGGGQVGADAGS